MNAPRQVRRREGWCSHDSEQGDGLWTWTISLGSWTRSRSTSLFQGISSLCEGRGKNVLSLGAPVPCRCWPCSVPLCPFLSALLVLSLLYHLSIISHFYLSIIYTRVLNENKTLLNMLSRDCLLSRNKFVTAMAQCR